MIGNTLEWYDFSLYGYFAVIISQLFFPAHDNALSLLKTFGIFAILVICRMIQGITIGGEYAGSIAASISMLLNESAFFTLKETYRKPLPGDSYGNN